MKHLKALLAAYRVTTPNTTDSIARSVDQVLGECEQHILNGGMLRVDADRVQKILAAVVADLRDEDARALKAAAK